MKNLLEEQESIAQKFIKIFQDLVISKCKDIKAVLDPADFLGLLNPYFDVIRAKIDSVPNIVTYVGPLSKSSKEHPIIEVDLRGIKIKKVQMQYSMQFFSEIISYFVHLIDMNFIDNEEVFKTASELLVNLILGFQKVQLENLKDKIVEDFYNELIGAMVGTAHREQDPPDLHPPDQDLPGEGVHCKEPPEPREDHTGHQVQDERRQRPDQDADPHAQAHPPEQLQAALRRPLQHPALPDAQARHPGRVLRRHLLQPVLQGQQHQRLVQHRPGHHLHRLQLARQKPLHHQELRRQHAARPHPQDLLQPVRHPRRKPHRLPLRPAAHLALLQRPRRRAQVPRLRGAQERHGPRRPKRRAAAARRQAPPDHPRGVRQSGRAAAAENDFPARAHLRLRGGAHELLLEAQHQAVAGEDRQPGGRALQAHASLRRVPEPRAVRGESLQVHQRRAAHFQRRGALLPPRPAEEEAGAAARKQGRLLPRHPEHRPQGQNLPHELHRRRHLQAGSLL